MGKQSKRLGRETAAIGKTNGIVLAGKDPKGFCNGLSDSLPILTVRPQSIHSFGEREKVIRTAMDNKRPQKDSSGQ
jgi:hypothetical protein